VPREGARITEKTFIEITKISREIRGFATGCCAAVTQARCPIT
jgi:hypothetical protein